MDSVEQQPAVRRLHAALEGNQFRLYYQPQVEQKSGRVTGVEALLRWQDPAGVIHEPRHFLQALETSGLIVAVGEWTFRQVAEDCRRWLRMGLPRLRVGINVSPVQLFPSAAESLNRQVDELRCVCEPQIEIDIAHLLTFRDVLKPSLETLRKTGADIAVQDYGIDGAVHPKLWSLPVDALKIHRDLIHRMTTDAVVDDGLTEVFAMANSCSLGAIAQGVETHEQLRRLAQLECAHTQGNLHSAPMPADHIERLLRTNIYIRPFSCIQRTGRLAYDA